MESNFSNFAASANNHNKSRLLCKCFYVNDVKFYRTLFLHNTVFSERLETSASVDRMDWFRSSSSFGKPFWKLSRIHRKTYALDSFAKITLRCICSPVTFANFFRKAYLRYTYEYLLLFMKKEDIGKKNCWLYFNLHSEAACK